MCEIAHLDIDEELEIQRIAAEHLEVGDVAAVVPDYTRQHRERARRVLHAHPYPSHGIARFGRMCIPAHFEPITNAAFRHFAFGTIDGVDHSALARNYQKNDAVT